jgi:hypothetical protein
MIWHDQSRARRSPFPYRARGSLASISDFICSSVLLRQHRHGKGRPQMKSLTFARGFRRVWIVISGVWLVYWVQAFPMKCYYRTTLHPQWANRDVDYYTCMWSNWQWYYSDLLLGGYDSRGATYYTVPDLVVTDLPPGLTAEKGPTRR